MSEQGDADCAFSMCNGVKYQLYVDLNSHSYGKYFINNYEELPHAEIHKNFPVTNERDEFDHVIRCIEKTPHKSISVCTNMYPRIDDIDDEIKLFMRKIFTLKPEYETYLKNYISSFPKNFNLFHYRIGDDCMVKDFINQHALDNFIENKKENSVLISDSLEFKKKIFETYKNQDVKVLLNIPYHSGYINRFTEKNREIDTLMDFMLIQNAKEINCYTIYGWVSNFVYWTSIIYDIPLNKLFFGNR